MKEFGSHSQRPVLFANATKIPDKDRQALFDALDHVNKNYFKDNQFIAETDQPTLADLAILATIASFVVSTCFCLSFSVYLNIYHHFFDFLVPIVEHRW